jgi:5-methyltetrahydrofolate--homocysteine methyltransferase
MPLLIGGATTLAEYIDWTPLFQAWELKGVYPAILDNPQSGQAARELFENARGLLADIIEKGSLTARAAYGFYHAVSEGDDIVLYDDEALKNELCRMPMLRQQRQKSGDRPHLCLADFVAPKESGRVDSVGLFACTAGIGVAELVKHYEADHDDYNAIMVKALADRLAEAYAELLHERARRDWGIEESLSKQDLIRERYDGIRPAPGYPACPDHRDKRAIFSLLDAESLEMQLTESCAMMPAASVSGLIISHPKSRYFAVGKIGRDQLESLAERREESQEQSERWLRPNLV